MGAEQDFIDEVTAEGQRDFIHLDFDVDAHDGLGPAVIYCWRGLTVAVVSTAQADGSGERFFLDVFAFLDGEPRDIQSLAWTLEGGETE